MSLKQAFQRIKLAWKFHRSEIRLIKLDIQRMKVLKSMYKTFNYVIGNHSTTYEAITTDERVKQEWDKFAEKFQWMIELDEKIKSERQGNQNGKD